MAPFYVQVQNALATSLSMAVPPQQRREDPAHLERSIRWQTRVRLSGADGTGTSGQ